MSFFSSITNKLVGIRHAFGIHIILKQEGYDLFLVELNQKKDSITLVNQQAYNSIEQILEILPSDAAIGVRISGKGILSKIIEGAITNGLLLPKLLPNAKPEDFYLQSFIFNESTYASIARKDLINDWSNKFKNHFLVAIELGDEAQTTLKESIDLSSSNNEPIPIGEALLNPTGIPAFSVALKSILSIEEGTLTIEKTKLAADEFIQKRIFQLGGAAILGIALIVLLANFILFQNYRNANAEIALEASKYMSINTTKDSLLSVIKQREDFLSKSGWMKKITISKELDNIAAIMPKELLLNTITFNPIDEKLSRELRKNQFQSGIIHISGETSNTVALNQWVNDINKMDLVNTTDILKYEYDSRNRVGLFKIAIKTK